MRLSVLIPVLHRGRDTEWLTEQCLKRLAEVEPELLAHTLILDDASEAGREFFLGLQRRYGVHWIRKDANSGYSANINVGLRMSRNFGYDFALTLNNDVFMKTPFVSLAEAAFNTDLNINVVGARLYYPDGRLQHQGFTTKRDGSIDFHDSGTFDVTRSSQYAFGVTGAFQIIRLLDVLDYDEQYAFGYEDVEFCAKQWTLGHRVYYESRIVGIHCEKATRGQGLSPKVFRSYKHYLNDIKRWNFDLIYQRIREANQ